MKWLHLLVLAVLSWAAAASHAQVQMTQGGHELDANSRLGSDGFNSPRNADPSGRFSGNMYITGQTTNGTAFRGRIPYSASNELGLTLPSEQLDNFVRDSAGLPGISAGTRTYAAQPFLRPGQTALGVRGIVSGMNAPGSNAPLPVNSGLVTPVAQRMYTNVMSQYSIIPTAPAPTRPMPGQPTLPTGLTGLTGPTGLAGSTGLAGTTAAYTSLPLSIAQEPTPRPSTSMIFGVLRPSEVEELQKELSQTPAEAITPEQQAQQAIEGARLSRGGIPEAKVKANQDVFTDMLMDMNKQQQGIQANINAQGATEAPQAPQEFQKKPANVTPLPTPPPEGTSEDLVEFTGQRLTVHALAGQGTDSFNRYMKQGDASLREGKFYEAAKAYQNAREYQRGNPLPAVGAGLSYLAAGEAFTAAHYLGIAMEMFPPLMEVRVDVAQIMGPDILRERLEDLKSRAEEDQTAANKLPMTFLLTYLYANADQPGNAREWAARLKKMAVPNTAIAAFANYVLTGERPMAKPAPN